MLGLPDVGYHLEFTTHSDGRPCPAPTADNLLVLCIPDEAAVTGLVNRLQSLGYAPVPPENPYWEGKGITIADPDGWRVVLFVGSGLDGLA